MRTDWQLITGGGFFELAESYLNFWIIGPFLTPGIISFIFEYITQKAMSGKRVLWWFVLFGVLSVFLRGALYQTFAYYKSAVTGIILFVCFWLIDGLTLNKSVSHLHPPMTKVG